MRNLINGLAALSLTFATTAHAQDARDVAQELGMILASETLCGLTLDQTAIAAFVTERVDPSNLEFADDLRGLTGLAEFKLRDMSAAEKTAHCTAITQSARHYGLTAAAP